MAYKFMQLAENWENLTDNEKIALFQGTNNNTATSAQLRYFGNFKLYAYDSTSTNLPSAFRVNGVHQNFVLTPRKLVGTVCNKISSMTITESISDTTNANIRYAITKDLEHYYTLSSGSWLQINLSAYNILNDGLSSSDISSITSSVWEDFYDGDNGIALAIAFHETEETQTTAVSNISVTADIKGLWSKAEHTVDYTYGYTSDTLHVDILTNGDYKINYGGGTSGGSGSGSDFILATNLDIDNLFV